MKTELVTNLKREATKIIDSLSKKSSPILITQRGRPAAYLVSVGKFEALNERIDILEKIARGEKAIFEGNVVTHEQAKKRMKKWLT